MDDVDSEDEAAMAAAQEMAWSMDGYRPSNAVMDVGSVPTLAEGGIRRFLEHADGSAPSAVTGTAGGAGETSSAAIPTGSEKTAEEDEIVSEGRSSGARSPMSDDMATNLEQPDDKTVAAIMGSYDSKHLHSSSPTAGGARAELAARVLEEANAASTKGRGPNFVPYNHWTDDATNLHRHRSFVDDQIIHARNVKGGSGTSHENYAKVRYYDVQGFNHMQPIRRSDPTLSAVMHTDEDTVLFTAGQNVTSVGIFDRLHRRFLLKKEDALLITALTTSQDGRHVAVAERLCDYPRVTLYRCDSSSEVAALSFEYVAKGTVLSMAMSSNSKFLSCSCGPADPRLVIWQLDDCRVLACVDNQPFGLPIASAVQFNPWNSQWLAVMNRDRLQLWNLEERCRSGPKKTCDVKSIVAKFGGLNDLNEPAAVASSPDKMSQTNAPALSATIKTVASGDMSLRTSLRNAPSLVLSPTFVSPASPATLSQRKVTVRPRLSQALTAVCWFDEDCVAVLTADGCIASFEDGELAALTKIFLPPSLVEAAASAASTETNGAGLSNASAQQRLDRQMSVLGTKKSRLSTEVGGALLSNFNHMAWVSRGLVVSAPFAHFVLLDRSYDDSFFQQVAIFSCFGASLSSKLNIVSISVSPAEETLVVNLSNNTMQVAILAELDDVLSDYVDQLKLVDAAAALERRDDATAASPRSSSRKSIRQFSSTLLAAADKVISNDTRQLLRRAKAEAIEEHYSPRAGRGEGDSDKSLPRRRYSATQSTKKHRTFEELTRGGVTSNLTSPTSNFSGELPVAAALCGSSAELERYGVVVQGESLFSVMQHVSLHHDTITGTGVALQLPHVVTCSADRMLRVFNYATRTVVAARTFDEEILSCAIHPCGLYVVIGLEFFAKCYMVLEEQFQKVAEMDVRGSHEIAYSAGGSRLAFAVGNRVYIYNANQFVLEGQLVGHTVMVKSIGWSNMDSRITTADMIGTICCWNTTTFLRDGQDASQNSLVILSCKYHSPTGLVAAVGTNKHATSTVFEGEFTIVCANPSNMSAVVMLRPGIIVPKAMSSRKIHLQLIAFAKISQTMFVGTPTGRVLMYSWPVLRESKPYDYVDAHSNEILHLAISPDERFLFSVGSDNVMHTFHLEQTRAGKHVPAPAFNFHLFDDLVFGLRSSIDCYTRDAAALRLLAAEFSIQTEDTLRQIEAREEAAMEAIRVSTAQKAEACKKRIEQLKHDKAVLDKHAIQEGNAVEQRYNEAASSLETLFAKVQEETALRHQQLDFEREEIAIRFESTVSKRVAQYHEELQSLERMRQDRESSLLEEVRRLESLEAKKKITIDAMLCQTVVDYEKEVVDTHKQHKAAARRNEDLVLRAMLAASVGDREVDRLKKDCAQLLTQVDARRHTIRDMEALLEKRKKETAELKQGMVAKQEAINIAERKMQSMKHQVTALENLRFVLTHQFETLESEVQPKDDHIAELEEAVVDREKSLNDTDETRATYREQARALKATLEKLEKERMTFTKMNLTANRRWERVSSELASAIAAFRDPLQFETVLRKTIKALKAENTKSVADDDTTTDDMKESDARSGMLRRELDGLQNRMALEAKHASDIPLQRQAILAAVSSAAMMENSSMIQEAKTLRAQKKELQQQVMAHENALRDVCAALHRIAVKSRTLAITEGPSVERPSVSPIQSDPLMMSSLEDETVTDGVPMAPLEGPTSGLATPSPAPGATPSTTAKALTKQPKGVTATTSGEQHNATRRLLPPLPASGKTDVRSAAAPTGSALRANSAEAPLTTWGGQPLRKKPSSAERIKAETQQQLHRLLAQLDDNAVEMQRHKQQIGQLRSAAQELLRMEEQRLLRALAQTTLPSQPSRVGDIDTTMAADLEEPDWVVRTSEPQQDGRPMSPVKKPAA